MSCILANSETAQRSGVNFQEIERQSAPSEIIGETRTISTDHEEAVKIALPRGQHKIRSIISYTGEPKSIDNLFKKIEIEGEFKRIFYHKIDINPVSDEKAVLTTTFHILDNPIPIVPIVWGASIAGSAVAGYFFVDKVESFSETVVGKLAIGATVLIGILTLFPKIKGA